MRTCPKCGNDYVSWFKDRCNCGHEFKFTMKDIISFILLIPIVIVVLVIWDSAAGPKNIVAEDGSVTVMLKKNSPARANIIQ